MIVHVLHGSGIGCLATLIPVGLIHRNTAFHAFLMSHMEENYCISGCFCALQTILFLVLPFLCKIIPHTLLSSGMQSTDQKFQIKKKDIKTQISIAIFGFCMKMHSNEYKQAYVSSVTHKVACVIS